MGASPMMGKVMEAGSGFPRNWSAKVLPTAPMIAPARQFVFPTQVPGEEDALNRGALFLEVRPKTGGVFLATCALGFRDASLPTGIWSCPAERELLAIAGGYAYRIDTERPAATELLEQRPVVQVLPAVEEGLLLLAGFHDVLALGSEGVRWRSSRLSWEGVTMADVSGGELQGTGWDMFADAEVGFVVDLQTGQHEGGGYRR